jgi:hypothetical protein
MPILVDGNNLLHQLPRSERSREAVRRGVLERTRGQRQRVTVVFDGPPPQTAPDVESLGTVTIRYAGSRAADDVIIATLPQGPPARQWVVVTDDRELQRRAREAGAEVRPLASFKVAAGRVPATETVVRPERPLSGREIVEWEQAFSGDRRDDSACPVLPRRRGVKSRPR